VFKVYTLLLLFVAEDDPDDADFEPDFGETGKSAKNKVSTWPFHSVSCISCCG